MSMSRELILTLTFSAAAAPEAALMTIKAAEASNIFMVDVVASY